MGLNIKEQMTELLSLPKEVMLNLPQVIITGNGEVNIENYKNIIEYTESKIRVNTKCGILMIEGRNLSLKQMTVEYIVVSGTILSLNYLQ